jgi:signal transduction histidine kinase
MRLAEFILANVEPILVEWEAFARGIWPVPHNDPAERRDHADQILRAAVRDMISKQSADEQADKSKGQGSKGQGEVSGTLDVASAQHGVGRVESGFNMMEVIAEYRALRASVIRLWRDSGPDPDLHDLDDLTRFNESIDQSLARAVRSFTERVDQSRQLFLAILGNDLRNPLNSLTMSAAALAEGDPEDADASQLAEQIAASAAAMTRMIDDLLTFTAAGLGGSMPLTRGAMDLDPLCREVVNETRSVHPACALRYAPEGDLKGDWDAARLREVISNLLGNAVQHGGEESGVELSVRGEEERVVMAVHNTGPPIAPGMLSTIFDPLRRAASKEAPRRHRAGSIGLGLYIVQQVVTAHGGTITVSSTADAGTTFEVRLPRETNRTQNGGSRQ